MKKTATALLALTATTVAFAAPTAGNFYVGGKVGQSTYHKTVKLVNPSDVTSPEFNKKFHDADGTSYGLFAGYRYNDHLAFEAGWQKAAKNTYVNGDQRLSHRADSLDLSVKANQFLADKFNVYAALGASVVYNRFDPNFTNFVVNKDKEGKVTKKVSFSPFVAAGAEYYLVNQFALGAEYKVNVRQNAYKGTLPEGVTSAVSVPAAEKVVAQTRSNEYKPDVHFVQGTLTYVFGQNKPAPVVVAPVVEKPAPVVTRQKFELKSDVLFATNKFDLNPTTARTAFAEVLTKYNSADNATVEVVGHADRTGNAAKNVVLSQKRAQSVANYLLANGVKKDSLVSVKGVGSSEPKTDGCYNVKNRQALRACLAPDRRVDVYVQGVFTEVKK